MAHHPFGALPHCVLHGNVLYSPLKIMSLLWLTVCLSTRLSALWPLRGPTLCVSCVVPCECHAEASPFLLMGKVSGGMRPTVPPLQFPMRDPLVALMQRCWDVEPDKRPGFETVRSPLGSVPLPLCASHAPVLGVCVVNHRSVELPYVVIGAMCAVVSVRVWMSLWGVL